MNFGEKVKQLRAERNLTQPQLAAAIGIEQSYLSKLENDKSVPSADIFQALLRALDLDVAALLEGVDQKVVRGDLRQIPEVANHVAAQTSLKVHDIKTWLFTSAVACVLGLALVVSGYRALMFSNERFNYASDGVVRAGEPTNIFDMHQGLLQNRFNAQQITRDEFATLTEEFSRRFHEHVLLLDEYRGEAFIQPVEGGTRLYEMKRATYHARPENRWLMLAGVLLTFAGLFGFIVEARLRRIRLS
jgi:transcriptional regulator with XRE-family HTH domain